MTYLVIVKQLISHRYTYILSLLCVITLLLAQPLYVSAQQPTGQQPVGGLAQLAEIAQVTPTSQEEEAQEAEEQEDDQEDGDAEEDAEATPTVETEPTEVDAEQLNIEPPAQVTEEAESTADTNLENEAEEKETAEPEVEGESYTLPYAWQGDATVSALELASVAPPLQARVVQGDFQISFVPAESGNLLRVLPVLDADSVGSIRIGTRLPVNSAGTASTANQIIAVQVSARVYAPQGLARLVVGDAAGSSSVVLEGLNWSDYQVTRQIAAGAEWLDIILEWSNTPANGWLEMSELTITVLPLAAGVPLSPTDTPAPTGEAVATPTQVPAMAPTPTARVIPTATPLPELTTAPAAKTPTPVAVAVSAEELIIVTSTPTAANVFEAATRVAQATEWARILGPSTPTPPNMATATPTATPIIVTNTPVPANAATAAYWSAYATAAAFTTGTPTPLPPNAVVLVATPTSPRPTNTPRPTATATPIYVLLDDIPVAQPTATQVVPSILYNKILFLTDYRGNPRSPNAMVMDPDGSNVGLLTTNLFYTYAAARDAYSADRRFYVYNMREWGGEAHNAGKLQLFYDDMYYNSFQHQLTYFGAGTTWAPAWSPTSETIAYVSSESRNDEIWISQRNQWPPMQLTKNEWEWDHHPSFSPDGSQIVFSSNRVSGRRQIWMMSSSGEDQRQITNFTFEAWDPVWVKYVEGQ